MKTHSSDLEAAREYQAASLREFIHLSNDQQRLLRNTAKRFIAWRRAHTRLHDAMGVALLAFLFASDVFTLVALPLHLPFDLHRPSGLLCAALVCGLLHGFLSCSIVTYSLHEGAAHDLIVTGKGPIARVLRALANNACRFFLADPVHYANSHYAHHRALGTAEDGSFTNHVRASRLLASIVPMAPLLGFSDYFPWRAPSSEHTPSRTLSDWLTRFHLATFFVIMTVRFGALYAVVALLVIGAWSSFVLDRLRESVEHLRMPLDRKNGTRDLGLGLWGLLLGAGPWGQPCHLSHHLEPALPWYQQIALHFHLRRILTKEQKRQFILRPFIGFPLLLVQIFRGAR